MIQEILIAFIMYGLGIVSAIVLSAGALYSGINMLNRLTHGIDEWKLIKSGNIAVGIFYGAVMLSIVLLVGPRIAEFVGYLLSGLPFEYLFIALFFGLVNYLLGLLAGIVIIFLTIHVMDRITSDLDEFRELERGNVAVAVIMAVVLISVVLASTGPLEAAFGLINYLESLI